MLIQDKNISMQSTKKDILQLQELNESLYELSKTGGNSFKSASNVVSVSDVDLVVK